jgi:hypothetical protein
MPLFTVTDNLGHIEIGGGHGGGGHDGRGGHGSRGFRGGFGDAWWGAPYYDYYDPWTRPILLYEDEIPKDVQIVRGR